MKTKLFALFIVLLCLFSAQSAIAQSREDRENITFTQRSAKLMKTIGWEKSPVSGKWVSHPNYVGDVNDPALHEGVSFNWMQIDRFKFKGIQHTGGEYRYPALHQDWISYQSEEAVILTLEEYNKVLHSIDTPGTHTAYFGTLKEPPYLAKPVTETDLLNLLTTDFNTDADAFDPKSSSFSSLSKDTLTIDYVLDKGKPVVRFDPLYLSVNLVNYSSPLDKVPGYYETDPATFKTLLLPLTPEELETLKKK
jgi:hypothetical protein